MKEVLPSIILGLFIIGGCFVVAGLALVYSASRETRFVETQGEVLSSEIRMTQSDVGTSSRSLSWRLFVTYIFVVDGVQYTSDVIGAERPGSNASFNMEPADWLAAMRDSYQPGDRVTVYFASGQPDTAILIKRTVRFPVLLLVGIVILGAAFYTRSRFGS